MNTHRKFNIAPENGWFSRLLTFWEGNFSGAMLNFGGGYAVFLEKVFGAIVISSQERTWIVQVSSDKQASQINGLVLCLYI